MIGAGLRDCSRPVSAWAAAVFVPVLLITESGCGLFRSERELGPKEAINEELCFPSNTPLGFQLSLVHEAAEDEAFGLSGLPAAGARALGLFPLLKQRARMLAEEEDRNPGLALGLIRLERRIARRLTLATLDLAAVSARVACEGNRARELADSFERNKNRRENRRTVASILAGAATNVLTGIFSIVDMAVTGGALGIAGGLTQYGLRGSGEAVDISVDFQHRRNFLRDLWDAPEKADFFPGPVWAFLTYSSEDEASLLQRTVTQWKAGRNITDDQSQEFKERYGVLFGSGGTYNLAQLRARAAMLDLLQSTVDLMHADLAVLLERMESEPD